MVLIYSWGIMERLTHTPERAYPVERSIMEEGNERDTGVLEAKARVADIVKRFEKDLKKNSTGEVKSREEGQRQKASEKEPGFTTGSPTGGFASFDTERFRDNASLEELAKMVRAAGRQNKVDSEFLKDIQGELAKRVQFGLVSDNWARNFTSYLNGFVTSENLSEASRGDRELLQDIAAIVQLRAKQGLTAEEAQASRVIWENAYGRKLTREEFQRIELGAENVRGKISEEFEAQIKIIESATDNPKRFESFLSTLNTQNPETIKQALSGTGGKIVLGVLLGDIADREKYYKRLEEILKKDPASFKQSMQALVDEIRQEEKALKPQIDPEKARLAKAQAEKWIEEQRQKRQVSAEEIDAVFNNAERAIPVIAGGADYYEVGINLLESIDNIPDEFGERFMTARAHAVNDERIELLAGDIYGADITRIRSEMDRFLELRNIDDPAVFKQRYKTLLTDLLGRANDAASDPKRKEEQRQNEELAAQLNRTGEVKSKRGVDFNTRGLEGIVDFQREPKNIREVAAWIMASDDRSVWGPEGAYPIFEYREELDPETGKQKSDFKPKNFIRWLRNKSLEHHADNPNDPLNLLSGISIETLFRSISILQMKYNKQKYFADEDGKPLSNLADEVINEAWLFGVRRNKNLGYIQAMNSDEKLFEAIVEMSGKNDHTGGETLAKHFQMGEDFNDKDGNLDNKVGDAMLAANQIYRNLADIDKLRKMMPENSPIFTLEGFKNASRYLNKKTFNENTEGYGNLRIEGDRVYFRDSRTKIRTEIFNSEGTLVNDENLVKFLNFFPEANPQETNEEFVRELVKQSIADIVGFDAGMDSQKYEEFIARRKKQLGDAYKDVDYKEYRKLMRMNLEWAETNSWVEQRWNGAAARNDTGYRGYDAWTKMYAQYYRERQSGPATAGPIGNPHDMQIFRMLTPDMWLAIRTETGESVHEVFEELHMTNLQLYKLKGELTPDQKREKEALQKRKEDAYGKLRFPRWAETDWASNGVKRQAEVWHNIMNTEDLKFNELAKRDNWGVLRYDRQKFEEVVKDDFIKKRRYALASNNAMNYGAIMRMRERDSIEIGKDGKVIEKFKYKDQYLAEAMFGEVVIGSIRREWYDGELDFKAAGENGVEEKKTSKNATLGDYLNSKEAREKILKNVCRAGLAAQIKAHRERSGTTERWNSTVIRNFYQSMRSMPQYIEDPATGKEIKLDDSQFFSEEDIKWIRKQTNTSIGMLLWEDSYHAGWDAAAEGIPAIFKIFYQDIVS